MKLSRLNDTLNLVWITDLHLSDRAPGRRSDQYRAQIFDKLRQVRDICVEHDAICLVGGDVFHIKAPQSKANPPSLIREAIEVFGSFPGAVTRDDRTELGITLAELARFALIRVDRWIGHRCFKIVVLLKKFREVSEPICHGLAFLKLLGFLLINIPWLKIFRG